VVDIPSCQRSALQLLATEDTAASHGRIMTKSVTVGNRLTRPLSEIVNRIGDAIERAGTNDNDRLKTPS
jgi:hypothetical protein